jgi:four helix bundle protein
MSFITPTHFPHHKLAAYKQALDLLALAKNLSDRLPTGYAHFANQMLRSAGSVVLNTGEGANGRSAGEKRNAFGIARKEAGETACAAEAVAMMGLVTEAEAIAVIQAADRVAGTLTGLVTYWSNPRGQ